MVVGMGDDPSPGEYERLLLSMKTTARKELVLLHPDRSVFPGSTREWLKVGGRALEVVYLFTDTIGQTRPWVHQHINVELPISQGARPDQRSQERRGFVPSLH